MIRRHRPLCTVNDRLGRGVRGIIRASMSTTRSRRFRERPSVARPAGRLGDLPDVRL